MISDIKIVHILYTDLRFLCCLLVFYSIFMEAQLDEEWETSPRVEQAE